MRSEMRQNKKFVRFVKECYFNKLLFPTPKRLFRRTFIPPIPVIALASNLAKAAGLLARSCMSLRNCEIELAELALGWDTGRDRPRMVRAFPAALRRAPALWR